MKANMTSLRVALQAYDAAPNKKEGLVVMEEGIKPAIQGLLKSGICVDDAYSLIGLTSDTGIRAACTSALETAFMHELEELHGAVHAAGVTLAEVMRIIRHIHIHMYCRTVTNAMKIRCLDEILHTVRYVEQTWTEELKNEKSRRQAEMLTHYRASAGIKHAELDANMIT